MKVGGKQNSFLLHLFFDPEYGGETLVNFQETRQRYISEGSILHNCVAERIKKSIIKNYTYDG
jgi:hypothetical protein